jgi:hypothetical protein
MLGRLLSSQLRVFLVPKNQNFWGAATICAAISEGSGLAGA